MALKVTLSLSDRYKIFTNGWLQIEIYQNVGFSKIDKSRILHNLDQLLKIQH